MCDVWYGKLELYTVDYNYGRKQYVMCGLGRPNFSVVWWHISHMHCSLSEFMCNSCTNARRPTRHLFENDAKR